MMNVDKCHDILMNSEDHSKSPTKGPYIEVCGNVCYQTKIINLIFDASGLIDGPSYTSY